MNKKLYFPVLAALLMLAGCTADNQDEAGGLVPLSLSAEIQTEATTRAGTALLNSFGDETLCINLTNCIDNNLAALATTTYTVGTGFSTQPYIMTGQTATVTGYYPSTAGSATSFTVSDNQTTDDNYMSSDLMYAAAQDATKSSPTPTLTFTHKMAKLIVNVATASGVNSITSVTLNNISRTVGWTAETGTLGALSNSGNITMSNCGAVLIPPQTTSQANDFLTVVTDAGTATYRLGKEFAGGSVYTLNISVGQDNIGTSTTITMDNEIPGALPGKFTIDDAGHKVNFSQGNLQATWDGSSWTWAFAEHQWDCCGSDNNYINNDGTASRNCTVDMFGWVGASSIWVNEALLHGITTSTSASDTDGYGNLSGNQGEFLKSDWGNLAITNGGGIAGSGWRTLTSAEWQYVFNARSGATVNSTANVRYTMANVNGINGVILFPDGVTFAADEATTWGTLNGASNWTTYCDDTQWAALAAKGCVFLPAAGWRDVTAAWSEGVWACYWSSTPGPSGAKYALGVIFYSGNLDVIYEERRNGYSVRLVRQVE